MDGPRDARALIEVTAHRSGADMYTACARGMGTITVKIANFFVKLSQTVQNVDTQASFARWSMVPTDNHGE